MPVRSPFPGEPPPPFPGQPSPPAQHGAHTSRVAAVAPPLTRWSSATLQMKPKALIRTRSTGP
jgi:hypothetical protein